LTYGGEVFFVRGGEKIKREKKTKGGGGETQKERLVKKVTVEGDSKKGLWELT